MGLFDKVKQILFDEDVVEVPVESDELPERTSKKDKKTGREEKTGFIEYHHEEELDENPIKEIKIPKEEKQEEVKNFDFNDSYRDEVIEREVKPVGFEDKFKDDFMDTFDSKLDDFRGVQSRSSKYDDLELSFMEEKEEVKDVTLVNSYRVKDPQSKKKEIKDYRKMLSDESQVSTEKKPFKNTPVISPVWGILDKNYTPADIVDKTETLNQINNGVTPRTFGPVSYNDQPLPTLKSKVTKEEIVEVNKTITEMVNDEVETEEIEEVKDITPEIRYEEEAIINEINARYDEVEPVVETPVYEEEKEIIEPTHSVADFDDEDEGLVIQTDNYDDYAEVSFDSNVVEEEEEIEMPTHSIQDVHESIESSNNDHNSIEDAFENTDKFDSIPASDIDDDVPEVDFETIVPKKKYNDDDEGLDNTIETDLFNLIDSMYKDEEDE